jgi:hypothetical protein
MQSLVSAMAVSFSLQIDDRCTSALLDWVTFLWKTDQHMLNGQSFASYSFRYGVEGSTHQFASLLVRFETLKV